MCGRYAASRTTQQIVEEFRVDEVPDPLPGPRFNIAPTDHVAAVVERAHENEPARRKAVTLRWGLVPSWAKEPTSTMINAREETVAIKPAFRRAFATRRCLLPADGYFEWYETKQIGRGGKSVKQPFFIHPGDGSALAMAGIYDFWKQPDGSWLSSVAIITTRASDALGQIHDRMPMTVTDRDAWLDPAFVDPGSAHDLLVAPADLDAHAVSRAVGNVRNDSPDLVRPIDVEQ